MVVARAGNPAIVCSMTLMVGARTKQARRSKPQPAFDFEGLSIPAGQRARVPVVVPGTHASTDLQMPVTVVHGRRTGPVVFVAAALHGDELVGVEVIRRLLEHPALRRLRGTILAVPVVNVHGFIQQERYLPDRRDLNRSFPGSPTGSLAARLAHVFMQTIVSRATQGIDLHTAAVHRSNLPQVRGCLDDAATERLCLAFDAPVVLNAQLRDGSLRQAAHDAGVPLVLYEAGEALRLDETAVRAGLHGVLSVLSALGMVTGHRRRRNDPVVARRSYWVRAPRAGVLRAAVTTGSRVRRRQEIGVVYDPLGGEEVVVAASAGGIVVGSTTNPLVNEGDALFHIAVFGDREEADDLADQLEDYDEHLLDFDDLAPGEGL